MIHGPCGLDNPASPCMRNSQCTKQFPKQARPVTEQGQDSYPLYRRRLPDDGGEIGHIHIQREGHFVKQRIDNTWVVPYNPFLLRQLQCHINVEHCASIKAIKYMCKYITKGTDQACFEIDDDSNPPQDETREYQNARYVG